MKRSIRIIVYLVLFMLVLMAAGLAYFFYLGGIEKTLNDQLSRLLGEDSSLQIRIGRVKGNLLTNVIVEDVTVTFTDSLSPYRMAYIPTLMTGYSISNFWKRRYVLDYLYVDSAQITIATDSAGHWLIPRFASSDSTKLRKGADFTVDDFSFRNWSLTLIKSRDTTLVKNLLLSGAVQTDGGTYTATVKQISFESSVEDVALAAASGKFTLTEGNLLFKDFAVVTGGTHLKASGLTDLRLKAGQVEFAVDQLDLETIARHLGPKLRGVVDLNGAIEFDGEGLNGAVSIGGDFMMASLENLFVDFDFADKRLTFDTLYGTVLGNCSVDGSGNIDFSGTTERYHLLADIKNFNLKSLAPNSFSSDLSGRINLDGSSFRSKEMLLGIALTLRESYFHDYPIQYASGSLSVSTEAVQFFDPFRVDYFENVFRVHGQIDYADSMDLNVDVELNNLDRYREKLFIDQPGGRGYAHARLSGKSSDPDLHGWFSSDSLWLYGLVADSAYAAFDIDRFLTARKGVVSAVFANGEAWELPYDSAYCKLILDSAIAHIDTVCINNEFAGAAARGRLNYGRYPQELALDTFYLKVFERTFLNRGDLAITVDSSGFGFEDVAIGNETADLNINGRIEYDESMSLGLSVSRVPVAPWLRLLENELPADGYVSCEAQLRGNFSSPRIELLGRVDSLVYRELVLGDMTLAANYEEQRLNIDSLLVNARPGIYTAQGHVYLDLAFRSDVLDRIPDKPFDLSITARDQRFDLVTLFMPSVEQLNGDFKADIRLTGTPSSPHLEGVAHLVNGAMKYYDLADTVFTDSAVIVMRDNQILVDNIAAYVKNKRKNDQPSYALIEGTIIVQTLDDFHYDLDITLPREFPFEYDLDDIRGVAEGDLHVEGNSPPLVTGDLTLVSAMYRVNFASADEGSPLMTAFFPGNTWDLNLNIDILSNYWIKNDDIDAEFGGFINLIREQGQYRFIGDMDILRGRGFLFDKTFRIEPNSGVVFEGTEYPNPRLDITAHTRIAGVRFDEEERSDFTELCIHITGTLETPEFNTCAEDATFTREDILPLIVANYYGGQNGSSDASGSNGLFQERVTQLVSSQISRIGSKQLSQLGVETFEIDPAYGGDNDLTNTQVTLGFYTGPNLYIYGRSTLSGQAGQALGFEYRFSRSLLLEGRRDEEELYHLNFNLQWEF